MGKDLTIGEIVAIPNTTTHNFNEWEPGFLCDYIVNTHPSP